jgi:hypothetical protein
MNAIFNTILTPCVLRIQLMKRKGNAQAGGLLESIREDEPPVNPTSSEAGATSARTRSESVNFESLAFSRSQDGAASLPGADPANEDLCERLQRGEMQCVEERHLQVIEKLLRKAGVVTRQIQRKFQ